MANQYCMDNHLAAQATGLSESQAAIKIYEILDAWLLSPNTAPSPAQRRELAAIFLAANDYYSAQVQWLRLPVAERKIDANINQALFDQLNRDGKKPNENFEIGVMLAVRLGLERVYAIDDHTADRIQVFAEEGFGQAINEAWAQVVS